MQKENSPVDDLLERARQYARQQGATEAPEVSGLMLLYMHENVLCKRAEAEQAVSLNITKPSSLVSMATKAVQSACELKVADYEGNKGWFNAYSGVVAAASVWASIGCISTFADAAKFVKDAEGSPEFNVCSFMQRMKELNVVHLGMEHMMKDSQEYERLRKPWAEAVALAQSAQKHSDDCDYKKDVVKIDLHQAATALFKSGFQSECEMGRGNNIYRYRHKLTNGYYDYGDLLKWNSLDKATEAQKQALEAYIKTAQEAIKADTQKREAYEKFQQYNGNARIAREELRKFVWSRALQEHETLHKAETEATALVKSAEENWAACKAKACEAQKKKDDAAEALWKSGLRCFFRSAECSHEYIDDENVETYKKRYSMHRYFVPLDGLDKATEAQKQAYETYIKAAQEAIAVRDQRDDAHEQFLEKSDREKNFRKTWEALSYHPPPPQLSFYFLRKEKKEEEVAKDDDKKEGSSSAPPEKKQKLS
jgi:hypothetical protein